MSIANVFSSRFLACGAILWLTYAIGCASGGQRRNGEGCALRPRDSTYAAGQPVYRDCAVDRQARLMNPDIRPDWTPPPSTNNSCFSVEMEFVVDENGNVERQTAKVLQTSDKRYADSWMRSLGEWKFEPAVRNGYEVRQIVTTKRGVASVVRVTGPAGVGRPPSTPDRIPKC